MKRVITIGTRGSPLALKQAEEVMEGLKRLNPEMVFNLRAIATQGDKNRKLPIASFGYNGVFVKELETHLQDGRIDIATHSMKDLPSDDDPRFCIAAIPLRQDPRDVLITSKNDALAQLPPGARLGSGSPRRTAQLKAIKPDLEVLAIRGNINTRMKKVFQGEYDGVVLAAAGLIRMGWEDRITEYFPVEVCLPAVGQGALAVEVRVEDEEVRKLMEGLDHSPSRRAVEAERALLRHMGGGCLAPITAYGCYEDGMLRLRGMVANPLTNEIIKAEVKGKSESSADLAAMLAEKLVSLGATKVLGTVGE